MTCNHHHERRVAPPTLLLHAADEKLVDIKNSILFFEVLEQRGPFLLKPSSLQNLITVFSSFRVIGGDNP